MTHEDAQALIGILNALGWLAFILVVGAVGMLTVNALFSDWRTTTAIREVVEAIKGKK
jgi:hypothetical protein